MECLEDRALLSASAIFSQATGILRIKGDGGSDTVNIEGTGALGGAAVYINGGHVGDYTNVRGIRVSLGAGDDRLDIGALRMNGNMTVNMGSGADEFFMDNSPDIGPNTDGDVIIGGNLRVKMGGDVGDLVDWTTDSGTSGIVVTGSVSLPKVTDISFNGNGGTYAVQNEDLRIQGNLKISMSRWGDANGDGKNAMIDDLNVLNRTTIRGSKSFERMIITDSRFIGPFTAKLGQGQNNFDLDDPEGPNWFGNSFSLIGKGFMETYDASPANVFNGPITVKGIENVI